MPTKSTSMSRRDGEFLPSVRGLSGAPQPIIQICDFSSGAAIARRMEEERLLPRSNDDGLDAVDWRKRVEQAFPTLASIATDPKLAGGRPEVECWRRHCVDVHRVAQHGEVGFLFRQPVRELPP